MKKILLLTGLLIAAFYAGMKVQAFIYEDTCLDLGGGKNPGNYPICVVEKESYSTRPSAISDGIPIYF